MADSGDGWRRSDMSNHSLARPIHKFASPPYPPNTSQRASDGDAIISNAREQALMVRTKTGTRAG
ncbi:hypothetical protein FIBSPDRAFT_879275 [Athelia psychrophila]|uniref:Uncharacterized protein n=1 Tax=Athelia psychrophila TaxID=1759441 RepID=A0A167U642_9AGAM|nr:hypothetical protein FIBSPDRAFT_879275 [Fibularhizoctonia sp. CBS 109695]